ncbi:MAG: hypothetical protein R3B81_09590 [bacterium]
MRKLVPGLSALVVLLAVAGVLWITRSLDSLVAAAIQREGSELTGSRVAVGGVELELAEGAGTVDRLAVGNPDGFSGRDAIRVERFTLDVDPATIRKSPLTLDELRVSGPELVLEFDDRGKTNLQVLRDRLREHVPQAEASRDPRLRVRSLVFEGGRVTVDATALGGKRTERDLPGFRLQDLGGAEGVPASEIGREALGTLLDQAGRAAATSELRHLLESRAPDLAGRVADILGRDGGS